MGPDIPARHMGLNGDARRAIVEIVERQMNVPALARALQAAQSHATQPHAKERKTAWIETESFERSLREASK
jgi:hypothetical protein